MLGTKFSSGNFIYYRMLMWPLNVGYFELLTSVLTCTMYWIDMFRGRVALHSPVSPSLLLLASLCAIRFQLKSTDGYSCSMNRISIRTCFSHSSSRISSNLSSRTRLAVCLVDTWRRVVEVWRWPFISNCRPILPLTHMVSWLGG